MPAQILGNPGYVIGLNQAIQGSAPSNTVYRAQLEQANASSARTFAINYVNTLADTNAVLAAKVLGNLGIANATLQTALEQAFAAFQTSRGAVVYRLVELLQGLEGDVTFGAAAATYNNAVTSNFAYSADPNSLNARPTALNTVTLTAATDIVSGNIIDAGLVFNPGGTDRVNSLQDEDRITGTGTNPTLNAILGNANDNGGTVIAPVLNNIQTANVQFTGSAAGPQGNPVTTLDLQDAVGLKTLNVTRINQALGAQQILFANINDAGTNTFGISGVSTPANIDYDFQEGALQQTGAASTEAATFNLNNVTLRNLRVSDNIVNGAGINEGFETVTINSQGANNQIDNFFSAQTRTLNITGAANLGLSNSGLNALVAGNNNGLGSAYTIAEGEFNQYQGQSFNNSGGPLAAINGSTATGRLTLDITGFEAGRPDPTNSGQIVYTTVQGGTANDTIISGGVIGDTNLVINGNGGTDTLVLYGNLLDNVTTNAINPSITNIENLEVRPQAAGGNIIADVSEVEGLQRITVRNETANPAAVQIDLRELTAAQAGALTINHGVSRTTGINGALGDSTQLLVNLDNASGTNDTVAISLVTDLNNTERFNFALDADGNAAAATTAAQGRAVGNAGVENITINDTDNEANIIELVKAAEHTGTITLTGGQAGQFLSLDATANAYRYDESGARLDGGTGSAGVNAINGRPTNGSRSDVGAGAAERLVAANFNSTAYTGDVIIRVSDNANAGSLGGQNIQFGAGNDTVIFDQIAPAAANRFTAGLTISDTVNGGAGTDILAIDGDGVAVTITASEWTNVSNFEVIRLVGNGVAGVNTRNGVNSYNLTLTNDLLATNGTANGNGKQIIIVNDNDATNDAGQANPANSVNDNAVAANGATNNGNGPNANIAAATGVERGVTIDARSLTANNSFEYRGEEGITNAGVGSTTDRFILADANINGAAIIDGGGASNVTQNTSVVGGVITNAINPNRDVDSVRNADVIEVRNAATVSEGDLANISNVGTLEFTNDTTVAQNSILVLNDAIVDRMVDAYQASRLEANAGTNAQSLQNQERLLVKAINNPNVAAATTGISIQAGQLTGLSALDVFLDRDTAATQINVTTGGGNDRVILLGNFNAGVYGADAISGENINAFANGVAGQRVAQGTITLGGQTGIGNQVQVDTLITYGAINIAGVVLNGVEALVANSDITLTESQFRALTSLTFTNATANHTITITNDGTNPGPIDLSKITVNGSTLTITNNSGDVVSNAAVLQNGGMVNIALGGAISITVAQAVAADFRGNDPVTVADTGANIAAGLTNGTLQLNDAAQPGEVDFFDATDNTLTTTVAGINVATNARLTAADVVTIQDTAGNIQALTDMQIQALTRVDVFRVAGAGTLTLDTLQVIAVGNNRLDAGNDVVVADAGVNIAANALNIAFANVDRYDATGDNSLNVTVAQLNALTNAKLTPADMVSVVDTGANIAALTAAQITALTNVDKFDSNANALTVSVAQAAAITGARFVDPDVVTISDTGATLAANVGGLGSNVNVGGANINNGDRLDATDNAVTLTAAQFTALSGAGSAKFVNGDTLTFAATTGADVVTLSGAHVGAAGVDRVLYTAGNQATVATFTDVANNAQLANADTFTFVNNTVDVYTGFASGTDKLNLAAFNLFGTPAAVTQFTANNSTVANGQFAIVQGSFNAGTGVFTADTGAGGTSSLVVWDADTSAAVSQVAVVLMGTVAVAADLVLA